ncbi:MAG: hypothetical protein HY470_00955 [Candidatus Ryanbacteria bacterium]|nr:hypothetical protein [Candidatus Ryanbacteria bacterium]
MKAISILLAAGAINGIGLFFYSVRTTDPQIVTSLFVVTTAVMMVVWAPILDHLFNGSIFSIYQLVGFGVIALGIYLLGR